MAWFKREKKGISTLNRRKEGGTGWFMEQMSEL